jgi:hypothetical protein
MTNVRQLCGVAVLVISLSANAFAGDMQCGVTSSVNNSTATESNTAGMMLALFLQSALPLLR